MKLTVDKKELDQVKQAGCALPRKNKGANFLHLIWLNATDGLRIQTTDSRIGFQAECQADVFEGGTVGVDCRTLQSALKNFGKGEIILSTNDEYLTLYQSGFEQSLSFVDSSWWQDFEPAPAEFRAQMDGKQLKDMLNRVKFVCDDERECFSKVRIAPAGGSNVEICAMNNTQFVRQKMEDSGLHSSLSNLTVSRVDLDKVAKWLKKGNVEIGQTSERLFFRSNGQLISVPTKEESWVDYSVFYSYFDGKSESLLIDKQGLLDALEKAETITTGTEQCCTLQFTQNQLVVKAASEKGKVEERMKAVYGGDMERIMFLTKQFVEAVRQFSRKDIVVHFTEETGPTLFSEGNYQTILMPVEPAD